MDLGLKGKVAFVACSSKGLGKACAMELAREGAHVMISARNEDTLRQTAKEIREVATGEVSYIVCDILQPDAIIQAVQTTVAQFGTIDILVNNAGGPPAGSFDTFQDEDWLHAFELNLLSYIRFIREVLPYMKKQRSGRIINLASTSVKQSIPGLLLSNTFRTGIAGLSKSLSQELAAYNILVNTVAPGRVATDRIRYLDETKANALGVPVEQVVEQSLQSIPLGRYGNVQEFGKVVAFLASDAASYMTGGTLFVDGGMVSSL